MSGRVREQAPESARAGVGAAAGAGLVAPLAVVLWLSGAGCAHPPARGPVAPVAGAAASGVSLPSASAASPARHEAPSPDATFWQSRHDLIQPPAPPPANALSLPRVERWKLPNGLDVVVVPRPGLPIVSFGVALKAGGYDEEKGRTEGVSDFLAGMLRKGTRKHSADAIALAIDRVGGALDAASDMEGSTVSCSVLAKDSKLCVELLAEMLTQPTFPEAEMPQIRDQMLAALAARTDDPHQLAAEHFDNLFFGEDNPDGWVLDEAQVRAIGRPALVKFWETFYRPNNAMLAVAGDVDLQALKAAVNRAFGAWKSAPIPPRPPFHAPEARPTRVLLVNKPDLTQATLMFGHRGIRHADPGWYAATLMNYVLGGSDFSSRLMTEVRSKRGLTYGIGSSFGSPLLEGAFRVSAATRNETAGDALRVAVDELRKMKVEGPTADELGKAKGYYAGSTPFALESAAGLAHAIVGAELHGLGLDYVRELPLRLAGVDRAAASAAARDRLDPDHLAVVIVGRASVIEPQLRKEGLPFETVDYRAPISAAARRAGPSPVPGAAPAR